METEIQEIFDAALGAEEAPGETQENALLQYALRAAVGRSGAWDEELVEELLARAELSVEGDRVPGLEDALEELRQSRPYLFQDGGARPRFSAQTHSRTLRLEEETVAQRYKNNPWYHG